MPIAEAFEQPRRGGLPRARGRGRRRAAGGGRRRRDRARRRQRPLASGSAPRSAATSSSGCRSTPREAWRRIAHSDRPLATSAEDVAALLAVRLPLYEELADAVVPIGDRGIVARALPAIQALAELPAGHEAALGGQRLGRVPGLRRPRPARAPAGGRWRAAASASPTPPSAPLYAERLEPLAARVEVEPGEGAKTMAEAERVLRELARAGMTREDHVVALGGGVVGDLAGFCAHLYQRGVPVVQVPTTLVAQVDSAYGGKTGVDLPEGKNYAGAYHLPAAVIADTDDAGDAAAGGAGRRLRRGR